MRVHRLKPKRVWEAGWRPLVGVEDCVKRRERREDEEEGERGSPASSSSGSSGTAGSLELKKRRKNKRILCKNNLYLDQMLMYCSY